MATGLSYRRVYEGDFNSTIDRLSTVSNTKQLEDTHNQQEIGERQHDLPAIPSKDLPVTCGTLRSVQLSLSSFFKRSKTLNLDPPKDTPRTKSASAGQSGYSRREPESKDVIHNKATKQTQLSREGSRSASYCLTWKEKTADDQSGSAYQHADAKRADIVRMNSNGLMHRPKYGYMPRQKAMQSIERTSLSRLPDPDWQPVVSPRVVRNSSVVRSSRTPTSILKRQLHPERDEETKPDGTGDIHVRKHACFKKHVDVFYFKPNDRLATIYNKNIRSDSFTRKTRRAVTAHPLPRSATPKARELEWKTEVTRLPLCDAQDHVNFLRLKVKVNCRHIRERTAVKALSGGRALVVTIHQEDVDVNGANVVRQHVKKFSIPVTIDPYRVKAHVHKDGLLTVDAPVMVQDNGDVNN